MSVTQGTVRDVSSGEEMHAFMRELYPFCRSITGDGLRKTLAAISARAPLAIREVPTGAEVLDWTVPREWNIREAWIKGPSGDVIVDFKRHNLHVMNYSVPVQGRFSLADLKPHLFSMPDRPDWIPYRTSYYKEAWGFCLSHNQLTSLPEGEYEVRIDSTLAPGSLTYGEHFVKGRSEEEILISCHVCHPSLANDNLSGVAVATALARSLAGRDLRYSYRFLFLPATIGAVAWLAGNPGTVGRIRHGFVVTGCGNTGPLIWKKSRRGDAVVDRAAAHLLKTSGKAHEVRDFSPYGYDERQYCSPGYDLPVGRISRTPYGEYPEYHTSADNLEFVKPERLSESLDFCTDLLYALEADGVYLNTSPRGEPQLGKRGLYRSSGGAGADELSLLWVLNLSDGRHSLLDIAERSGLAFAQVAGARDLLVGAALLRRMAGSGAPGNADAMSGKGIAT